jgi:hypothetical protein
MVLLYDSKYLKDPGKLQMHWFSPFLVADIRYFSFVYLAQLDGILWLGWLNGTHLKPFTPTL